MVKTQLQDPFSYSIIPIVFIFIVLLSLTVYLVVTRKKSPKTKKVKVILTPNSNINNIKEKYLKEITKVENNLENNLISNRKAYQELSMLIRTFVYEVTNINVQSYTLSDIKVLNIQPLYELLKEYYHPEFAFDSQSDIKASLNKTREVIVKWN